METFNHTNHQLLCSSKGQQTFSEEVTERTRSQLLKLEKENQSLLRTIEELSTKSKESSHQMCSSTDFNGSKQACCSVTENSELLVNGGSNCHQDLSAEARTRPFDTADCCRLESRQLEDAGAGKDLQETMSNLVALENVHNALHALDGSETPNGSRLHHDGIFTGLPARSSYANKHTQRLEAKVRALDAVNLQLQTSLDSSGGFCRTSKCALKHCKVVKLFALILRSKGCTFGGGGSGAGSREPDPADFLGGTSDLCETPGAARI